VSDWLCIKRGRGWVVGGKVVRLLGALVSLGDGG